MSDTFTEQGVEWNRHKPGDPMPCIWEQKIQVLRVNGISSTNPAGFYDWGKCSESRQDLGYEIAGWRYAEEPSSLEAVLREAIKNAGKGSMNGKHTWHFRWDDVEKLNKLLSPPPPTVLPI